MKCSVLRCNWVGLFFVAILISRNAVAAAPDILDLWPGLPGSTVKDLPGAEWRVEIDENPRHAAVRLISQATELPNGMRHAMAVVRKGIYYFGTFNFNPTKNCVSYLAPMLSRHGYRLLMPQPFGGESTWVGDRQLKVSGTLVRKQKSYAGILSAPDQCTILIMHPDALPGYEAAMRRRYCEAHPADAACVHAPASAPPNGQ